MFLTFIFGPWSSAYLAGNSLDWFALLLCAGLSSTITFRGGLMNLGLDSQIYCGGLAATVVLLSLPADNTISAAALFLAAGAAMLCGFIMGAVCGFLKKKRQSSEIITTFLLGAALIPVADYIINAKLREESENLLTSRLIPSNFRLPHILEPSNLSISFIIVIFLTLLTYIFLNKTKDGYRFRMAGDSPAFARYGGIECENYYAPVLGAGGAIGGLCGFFAVSGTYGRCWESFTGGIGWAAIAVALLAKKNPIALVAAALFYAQIKLGSDAVLLNSGMAFETSSLVQGAILLLAALSFRAAPKKLR
ncbi:MAG: ABC transporter permease [Termitinemataceae bacterium]|nr:MAG: ABC transporter permease [Termitinemataceae bacterium]